MFNQLLNLFSNDNNKVKEGGSDGDGDGDLKKYKISDVIFYDERQYTTFSADDPFMSTFTSFLKPGEYSTKEEINRDLQSLTNSGMFEKLDLEYTSNSDASLGVTIFFTENIWPSARNFRCINVGVTPQTKPYNLTRPCLLPPQIEQEVMKMIQEEGKHEMSARLLHKIKERVENWYHDEGYIGAQLINISNLETKEVVGEVVEGDITKLEWVDGNNNNINATSLQPNLKRLFKKLEVGNVYNIQECNKVLKNFEVSSIEVNPRSDQVNEGGVIVEIKIHSKKYITTQNNFIENWPINILTSSFSDFFLK